MSSWGQLVGITRVWLGKNREFYTAPKHSILMGVYKSQGFTMQLSRFFQTIFHKQRGVFSSVNGMFLPIINTPNNNVNKLTNYIITYRWARRLI
jgi:hypothetical protein